MWLWVWNSRSAGQDRIKNDVNDFQRFKMLRVGNDGCWAVLVRRRARAGSADADAEPVPEQAARWRLANHPTNSTSLLFRPGIHKYPGAGEERQVPEGGVASWEVDDTSTSEDANSSVAGWADAEIARPQVGGGLKQRPASTPDCLALAQTRRNNGLRRCRRHRQNHGRWCKRWRLG